MDIGALIGVIAKGGPAAVLLSLFVGLAALIREVRGGKLSEVQKAELAARNVALEQQLSTTRAERHALVNRNQVLVYQRDQARVRVEYLEQVGNISPRTAWPEED